MSEQRIIRHSSKSSRNRVVAVLLAAFVCSVTVTCQLVIGDLPLRRDELKDGGPPDEPDGSVADVVPETGENDAVPENERDSADTGVEVADSGDAGSDAEHI